MEDCCWACVRDQLIWPYRQASLGGITSLRLWRKWNCEAQTSWHCLETELNTCAKTWLEFPTHLETALSKMSWPLRSNSCTSDTGIMPSPELAREERVSRRTTLRWEMSCSVSRVAWASAPTSVWKSHRLISLPLSRGQGDIIQWSQWPESKSYRVARKIMNQFGWRHLGSQRHRCKKNPSLAPQFMSSYTRSKPQFKIIRKSTNQVKKPRRDSWHNCIRLIQGSIQFWCLKGISEDGI